tara:strand:- start:925 stop:1911 length:987 start_codon:yes stop_codon:yes gene_type:complete
MHKELIKDIGEKELIRRIAKYMPENQASDDCAYIETKKKDLLINTDLMVENTHFNHKIISPRDIGWKAVTTNYSDLISSGCIEFIGINIGLVLAPNTEWEWVQELYEGFSEALNEFGGAILGGDCSRGEKKMVSITAIGLQSKLKLRRNACKPGEILLTTGMHGLSKLGLLIKTNKINKEKFNLNKKLINLSMNAFCRPTPKYKFLKTILKSSEFCLKKEIGCTDSSDGFYQAIFDLSKESKCKAVIDYQKIPKNDDWPKGETWDQFYFFGGEDYELLISLPRDWANKLLKMDYDITEIGYFAKGNPSVEIKNYPNKNYLDNNSYSHF